MKDIETKPAVSLHMLILFSILFFMGRTMAPAFAIFLFFVPVPLVLAGIIHGIGKLSASCLGVGLLLFLITGNSIFPGMYILLFAMPAVAVAYTVLNKYDASASVTAGFLALCTGTGIFFNNLLSHGSSEISAAFSQVFSVMGMTMKSQGLDQAEITKLFEQIQMSLPLTMMILLLGLTLLNYLLVQFLSKDYYPDFPFIGPMKEYRAGVFFCFLFIFAVTVSSLNGSSALFESFDTERVKSVAGNLTVICRIVFFINAVTFILWFIDEKMKKKRNDDPKSAAGFNIMTAGIMAGLLLFIKELTGFLVIFGILDSILDFRNLIARAEISDMDDTDNMGETDKMDDKAGTDDTLQMK